MHHGEVTAAPVAVLLLALVKACGEGPVSSRLDRVPLGPWGGDHVSLAVETSGAAVEFDCAHGTLDAPLRLDREGRFSVPGVFVREHGGPVHQNETEDKRPAVYRGETDGQRLTFVVALTDTQETLGPFTAFFRRPPRVFKCL